jgi:hypothetical protein
MKQESQRAAVRTEIENLETFEKHGESYEMRMADTAGATPFERIPAPSLKPSPWPKNRNEFWKSARHTVSLRYTSSPLQKIGMR